MSGHDAADLKRCSLTRWWVRPTKVCQSCRKGPGLEETSSSVSDIVGETESKELDKY